MCGHYQFQPPFPGVKATVTGPPMAVTIPGKCWRHEQSRYNQRHLSGGGHLYFYSEVSASAPRNHITVERPPLCCPAQSMPKASGDPANCLCLAAACFMPRWSKKYHSFHYKMDCFVFTALVEKTLLAVMPHTVGLALWLEYNFLQGNVFKGFHTNALNMCSRGRSRNGRKLW